jgi:N-formylglutamate deformylase
MTEPNSTRRDSVWGDEDFLRAFEDLSFPAELFHHREHLRVAWLYLQSSDASRAAELMAGGIRRFANHQGATQKYHHTLTKAWMRLAASALV